MTPGELQEVRSKMAARGGQSGDPGKPGRMDPTSRAGAHTGHSHQQPRPLGHEAGRANPFGPTSRTRIIGVSSGKGGVGKSSITVNVAGSGLGRSRRGRGWDADVYGFSIPSMLGVHEEPTVSDLKMLPPGGARSAACRWASSWRTNSRSCGGDRCCTRPWSSFWLTWIGVIPSFSSSTCLRVQETSALSMAQYLPTSEVYVVTTPQPAARRVAQRSAFMAKKLQPAASRRDREHELAHDARRRAPTSLR